MTQPDLRPPTPDPLQDAKDHLHAEFVSTLHFRPVEGVFDQSDSRLYYDAITEIRDLVSTVEPGTLIESNREVWPQIRDMRNRISRAMQQSFTRAKESHREYEWLQRAVEHSNKIPSVTQYFMQDVLFINRDYQPQELNFTVPARQ